MLYFSLEGLARSGSALFVSEIVPTLPAVLAFKVYKAWQRRREIRRHQELSIPDRVETLDDGARLQVHAWAPKMDWNSNITIGVRGDWYEVERKLPGVSPRPFVYLLRRVPPGKILRSYQEYDINSAEQH